MRQVVQSIYPRTTRILETFYTIESWLIEMSVIDEGWSLEDEVEVFYTVWSCHHQEEQELIGIFTDATKAINCLADYTHNDKYNGHVVRAEPYVLDKAFVPLKDLQNWDWKKH